MLELQLIIDSWQLLGKVCSTKGHTLKLSRVDSAESIPQMELSVRLKCLIAEIQMKGLPLPFAALSQKSSI